MCLSLPSISLVGMMKRSVTLLAVLIVLFDYEIISGQQESQGKRITHAPIKGEVRGNGSLPVTDENAYLLVELRFSRDDLPQSIARRKVKLFKKNVTQAFVLPFQFRYPLSKISPHNTYILSAKIFDGQNQLLYIGDRGLPVTERRENQAKHLVVHVIPTRKRSIFFLIYISFIHSSVLVQQY